MCVHYCTWQWYYVRICECPEQEKKFKGSYVFILPLLKLLFSILYDLFLCFVCFFPYGGVE